GRNLDEFVMVRGREWLASPDAKRLTRLTHALLRDGERVFRRQLVPALAQVDIHIADYDALGPAEQDAADRHFRETVLPLVAPIFCDGAIVDAPNLGLNLVADLRQGGRSRLAILRVPDQLPALVELPSGRFVWLDQVVFANRQSV